MRVIRLQVSAMRYSPGGGTRECWIRGEERGGGGGLSFSRWDIARVAAEADLARGCSSRYRRRPAR
jgi:hypothetical protein